MEQNLLSSADLVFQGSSCYCLGGSGSQAGGRTINDASLLTILEVYCFEREKKKALKAYRKAASQKRLKAASRILADLEKEDNLVWARTAVSLANNSLILKVPLDQEIKTFNLSTSSQASHQILRALQHRISPEEIDSFNSHAEAFERGVHVLEQWGMLVPPPGHLHWGQFRRMEPFCKNFGFSRGTPIDRYYLNKFIHHIRSQVRGNTLEIGGAVSNGTSFGFEHATEYHALDLNPSPYNDFAGDAHDPSLIAADTFDSIVCFNVLEHCTKPWIVAENIHKWLKKGGKAFCMVPNAQRLHELPRDYWRPFPAALESMFHLFSHSQLYVYGNLITHMASYYGIACEELRSEELDFAHPDYPVASCLVADK